MYTHVPRLTRTYAHTAHTDPTDADARTGAQCHAHAVLKVRHGRLLSINDGIIRIFFSHKPGITSSSFISKIASIDYYFLLHMVSSSIYLGSFPNYVYLHGSQQQAETTERKKCDKSNIIDNNEESIIFFDAYSLLQPFQL